MATLRPAYCSGSSFGLPTFGDLHPEVEQIKERANARRRAGAEPRSVDLIFKFAKNKDGKRATLHQSLYNWTGVHVRSFMHWALSIGSQHFELYRIPGTSTADFVAHSLEEQRLSQVTDVHLNYGSTYMTDEEIVAVGKHYISCWRLEYQALHNNCQIILIAVCKDCLVEPDDQLRKAWAGYKIVSPIVRDLRPVTHLALRLAGCPKETRQAWDDEMIDYYLTYMALLHSDRFGQYERLKDDLSVTEHPFQTLTNSWLRRIIYDTHMIHSATAMFPFVKNRGQNGAEFEFTNLYTANKKWANRTMIPVLPASVVTGTVLFARDAAQLATAQPRLVRDAFRRRSDAKFEKQLAIIEADGLPFLTPQHSDSKISVESFESAYRSSQQALQEFCQGKTTLEETVLVWRRMVKSGDVDWKDIAQDVRAKRLQRQGLSSPEARPIVSPKERRIRSVLNFLLASMCIVAIAGVKQLVEEAVLEDIDATG